MESISPEIVEKTWKKMAQMSSPQEAQKMVTLMSKKTTNHPCLSNGGW